MKPVLEIACFNFESAMIAQQGGADRIELCEDFSAGGLTPKPDLYTKLKSKLHIPVFVMIRPRPGDFVYSDEEFEQMKREILYFKESVANGFVFGILKHGNEIDIDRNDELVKLASPLPCTFHRAFDNVTDHLKSLEVIINCGFSRILTSGSQGSAFDNLDCLSELISKARNRIIIIPGGGVRSGNITEIKNSTGAIEFHSSAIIKNNVADENEIKLLKQIINDEI